MEPVIPGIFIVELERILLPRIIEYMTAWKAYVDDTITTVKLTSIDHALKILNTFHKKIKFTSELEINKKISSLDVLLIRKNDTLKQRFIEKELTIVFISTWIHLKLKPRRYRT